MKTIEVEINIPEEYKGFAIHVYHNSEQDDKSDMIDDLLAYRPTLDEALQYIEELSKEYKVIRLEDNI